MLPSSYTLHNVTFDRKDLIGKGGEAAIYSGHFAGQRVVVREVLMPRKNWCLQAGQNIIKVIQDLLSILSTVADTVYFSSYTAR